MDRWMDIQLCGWVIVGRSALYQTPATAQRRLESALFEN